MKESNFEETLPCSKQGRELKFDALAYTLKYILKECQGAPFNFEELMQKALEDDKECMCCCAPSAPLEKMEDFSALSRAQNLIEILLKSDARISDSIEEVLQDGSVGSILFHFLKNMGVTQSSFEEELNQTCNKIKRSIISTTRH